MGRSQEQLGFPGPVRGRPAEVGAQGADPPPVSTLRFDLWTPGGGGQPGPPGRHRITDAQGSISEPD